MVAHERAATRSPENQPATPARAPAPAVGAGRAAQLLALQRTAGNRAVGAALQRRTPPPGPTAGPTGPTVAPATQPAAPGPDHDAVAQRGFLDDLVAGAGEIAGGARDRVVGMVRDRARQLPGYDLLCVVLGRDVVTGQAVARSGAALLSGFVGLVPGSERVRQQLQESGAIERAGQWLDEEVPKLGLDFDSIRGLFRSAVESLGAGDLLDPLGAVARIVRIFTAPVQRLRDFARGAVRKLMEFVVEGAMALAGGAGSTVMGVIRRAGAAFDRIVADPVGFAGNLVSAVRGGLSAFLANIGNHLRNGLIGWLTGALGGIVRLPQRFDLPGIVGLALDFLGLTWERVRGKLVRLVGERAVGLLERGAGIVADLVQNGLGAITGRIAQFTSGIVDTVLGGIREWVTNSVVGAAITRLLSMFNPAGAVIQAAIAIYNTIQFFIERGRQIATLADAVFDSITAIANGGVGAAVQAVEGALARAVPVVLGFLSRLIGLGDVAAPVRSIMGRVHQVIDQALDRVVGWIAGLARRVRGGVGGRDAQAGTPRDLTAALADANALLNARGATPTTVRAGLAGLRRTHALTDATLVGSAPSGPFHIHLQREEADTEGKQLSTDAAATAKMTLRARPIRASGLSADAAPEGVAVLSAADRQYLSSRWLTLAARDTDPGLAETHRQWAADALAGRRPDPRASEQEIAWLHESVGGQTQVSYRHGRAEGGEGSTRPDVQVSSWNVETKRYIINRPGGRRELIAELKRQYTLRLENLPAHLQFQAIIVDVRGQYLTPDVMQELRQEIYRDVVVACYEAARANGAWTPGPGAPAPGQDTVTILAGEVG